MRELAEAADAVATLFAFGLIAIVIGVYIGVVLRSWHDNTPEKRNERLERARLAYRRGIIDKVAEKGAPVGTPR